MRDAARALDRLSEHGNEPRGMDQAPEFIGYARATFPHITFELGRLDHLPDANVSRADRRSRRRGMRASRWDDLDLVAQ